MRHSRLIVFVIIISLFYGGWVSAQEATDEPVPEATEEATPAPEVTAEPDPAPISSAGGTHTVAAGETLYRIAFNNGTTVDILAQLNNISNPAQIYTGQVLKLPTADNLIAIIPTATEEPQTPSDPEATAEPDSELLTTDSVGAEGSYVVQPGDTLFRIASSNNTTMAVLQTLNNMANVNLIFAGQSLILPEDNADAETVDETADSASEVNADFGYGVQVYMNISNTAAIASQISQLGVDWVKVDVSWADIEPLQGEFDYTALDTTVQVLDALGINLLLNVYDAPAWTRENYVLNQLLQLNSGPPEDNATFGAFMTNVATRYTGVVDAYEIWKSPNLLRYWTVPAYATPPEILDTGDYGVPDEIQIGAAYYVDLLEVGYNAVKAVDSNALVMTAGLAPVGSSDNYNFIATGTFLNNMMLLGGADYSDAIGAIFGASAVPPTALCCNQPPGVDSHYESFLQYFLEILDFYNDIMARNDVDDMPIFITQAGWGIAEGGVLAPPSAGFEWLGYTSQDEQAIYVSQAFEEARNLDYIDGLFLSNLNGCSVGDAEACYFSLIDSNGTARPAFGALQNLDKSTPES
jgi:polysaccharide biosynthesis protein PslG